jgi:heme oxygenase
MIPLKDAIHSKHRAAEQTIFSQRMVQGNLTTQEYKEYLFQLYCIFSELERNELPHKDLYRLSNIILDIFELHTSTDYLQMCPSTFAYILYLHQLTTSEQVLPHVYLNYFAIMFGGQIIKGKVPGNGQLYQFSHMQDAISSIRNLQKDEWAEEANIGLDFHIRIFDELQKLSERHRQ